MASSQVLLAMTNFDDGANKKGRIIDPALCVMAIASD
jgi:hypothetical protein